MNDNDWDLAGWLVEFPFVSAVFWRALWTILEIATQLLMNSSIVHRLKFLSQEKPDTQLTVSSVTMVIIQARTVTIFGLCN